MSGEVRISAWDWEGWRYTVVTDPMTDHAIEDEYVPTFPLHPFVTLESAMENLQALKVTLGIIGHSEHLPPPKIGTPAYSYAGVEEALTRLFQELVIMLPEEHERTEGD